MRFDTPTADRIAGLVFFTLGAAMTYGGYVMDRLEFRQIHPASIPGLVPMILGVALMICAALLAVNAEKTGDRLAQFAGVSWKDLFVALALCGLYALGMVGRVPFGIATALFITAFSGWFLWPPADANSFTRMRIGVGVIVFGIVISVAISLLFRYAFLVRLP